MGAVVMVTRARTAGDQEMCAGREPDNNCGVGLGGGGAVATAVLPNVSGHHSGHYTGHHPALLCIAPGHWHTGPHHGGKQGDIGGPAYNGEAGYDQDMI